MSFSSAACCVAALEQQRQRNSYYHKQCQEQVAGSNDACQSKTRTVVENGRVVVKPLPVDCQKTD